MIIVEMKRFISLSVLAFCFLVMYAQPVDLFRQGNEAYRQSDYLQAIEAYTAVLDAGYENADLYYNLGNAYYRTEQMGMAVLCYERALRIEPGFAEAKQNLALANARTEDKITPIPEFLLARWYRALNTLLPPTGWLITLLVLGVLAVVAVGLIRFSGSYPWRKTAFVAIIVIGVLLLVTICCTFSSINRYNRHDRAVVTQPMVVVKGSPDDAGVDKLVLHEGTTLVVDEALGTWYKVRLADGNTGWLPDTEITII